MLTKNSQSRSLTQAQFMRTSPGANCGLRAKIQTLCHDMSSLDRGLVLRLWSRLHLSIKVSNCGVLQQTDIRLGRLLAGTKACQETRSTYSRPSISPNLEIRDLGPELYVFQMQRPVISLPRSRMKKTTSTCALLVRSRPPPLRGAPCKTWCSPEPGKKGSAYKKKKPPPDLLVESLLKGILPQSKNKRVDKPATAPSPTSPPSAPPPAS